MASFGRRAPEPIKALAGVLLLVALTALPLAHGYRREEHENLEVLHGGAAEDAGLEQSPCSIVPSSGLLMPGSSLQVGGVRYGRAAITALTHSQRSSLAVCVEPLLQALSARDLNTRLFASWAFLQLIDIVAVSPFAQQAAQEVWRLARAGSEEAWDGLCVLATSAESVVSSVAEDALTATSFTTRASALKLLRCLAPTSALANQTVENYERMCRKSYDHFTGAVTGSAALGMPEKLGSRFKASRLWFDPTIMCNSLGSWLPVYVNPGRDPNLFVTLPASLTSEAAMTEACAKVCATATPYVMRHLAYNESAKRNFENLLKLPPGWDRAASTALANSEDHCSGFAVTQGRCYLFRTVCFGGAMTLQKPSKPAAPVKVMVFPGSVSFCTARFEAVRNATLKIPRDTATLTKMVVDCQQDVFVAGGGNPKSTFSKFLCAEECKELVDRMRAVSQSEFEFSRFARGFEGEGTSLSTIQMEDLDLLWGAPCSKMVVQLVERTNLKCCALSCGWDAASKRCGGASLLPAAGLNRWWLECCHTGTVLFPSDRQRMCDSVEPLVRGTSADTGVRAPLLEARSSEEAYEAGETIQNPLTSGTANITASTGAVGPGGSAALVEVSGSARRTGGDDGGLNPCTLSCSWDWSYESSLIQCSAASNQGWFATSSTAVCTTPISSQAMATPQQCGENATAAKVKYASWQLMAGTRVGTCRHFDSRCDRNWVLMTGKKKLVMDNITNIIWRGVML